MMVILPVGKQITDYCSRVLGSVVENPARRDPGHAHSEQWRNAEEIDRN
jgi:hypothetical protein